MHIVYVSREYPPTKRGGGIASYVYDMATYYANSGHKVTVIAASDDTRDESDIIENGVRVIRLSKGDFIIPTIEKTNLFKKLRCVYRFYSYRLKIRETILSLKNVDIIEVAEYGAESYYLHNIGIPVVVRLHTPASLDRSTFGEKKYSIRQFYECFCASKEKQALLKSHYITSCSTSLKQWVVKYWGIDENIIRVIYNPIHLYEWVSETPTHFNKNSIKILYVGTVIREKGIGDLIEACKLLCNQGIKIELTVAGKLGQYGENLLNETKNYGWCSFLGNVNRSDLRNIYSSHEIACFPSWWEAFGLICTEAMSCPMLTIGSNHGGMSEIIDDGINGFLIEPQDPQSLSKKIYDVWSMSDTEKETIRKNALKKIKETFDISNIGAQMLDYYQFVINQFKKL